jgi:hypothetical protein
MPSDESGKLIGHLDDELREAAKATAARGVPQDGVRKSLVASFGQKRLAAFETDCPDEIDDIVQKALLGFGASDDSGLRLFEKSLDENNGDVSATIKFLRANLGRKRTSLLISEHPKVEPIVAAASRTYGQASKDAADRRITSTASMTRKLRPESSLDFEALAQEAIAENEPKLASPLPREEVDPTLVANPEMENVNLDYVKDHPDMPDPTLLA